MEKLFEKAMKMETAEAFNQILKIQTETYGSLEINKLSEIIGKYHFKSVLDIGTGEGSFLLNLAKNLKDVDFTGIDHNEDLLNRSVELKGQLQLDNVQFTKAFFNNTFPTDTYDMILTRFTLQHASAPQAFLNEAFTRLNEGGIFVSIDEYLFDMGTTDPVWNEFYTSWIRCFELAGCNHLISSGINICLEKAGFKDIENSVQLYSPLTIGGKEFKTLVTRIASLLYNVYPEAWNKTFFPKLEEWLNEVTTSHSADPFIPVAHVIAKK